MPLPKKHAKNKDRLVELAALIAEHSKKRDYHWRMYNNLRKEYTELCPHVFALEFSNTYAGEYSLPDRYRVCKNKNCTYRKLLKDEEVK